MLIIDQALVIDAAKAGAEVVRSYYGSSLARIDKAGGDFATAADLDAEKAIVDILRAARPDDVVLGEEGGRTGLEGSGRMWLVDPLCGTLNYAARNMLVSVNVALQTEAGVAVAASRPQTRLLPRAQGHPGAAVPAVPGEHGPQIRSYCFVGS